MGGGWSGFEDGLADFLAGGSAFGQYAGQGQGQGGSNVNNPDPPKPKLAAPTVPYVQKTTNYTPPPQQAAIGNNFSTTNQYQARYGSSATHF